MATTERESMFERLKKFLHFWLIDVHRQKPKPKIEPKTARTARQEQEHEDEDEREDFDKVEHPEESGYEDSSDSDLIEFELDKDEG
jgi:hypothetical protein